MTTIPTRRKTLFLRSSLALHAHSYQVNSERTTEKRMTTSNHKVLEIQKLALLALIIVVWGKVHSVVSLMRM